MNTYPRLVRLSALSVLSTLILGISDAQAESFNYFSRSSAIGEDNVWVVNEYSEGQYVLDMHIRRWDDDNNIWTRCVDGKDCNTNEGELTFGTPIYSPVDGVIRGCWRRAPDNPAPGNKLPGIEGNDDPVQDIPGAGNHLNIETPEGNLILIAHFKDNTIPPEICPKPLVKVPNFTQSQGNSFPDAYLIEEADRPAVVKGQLLGYAGNSGNSSGPHIHIRIAPIGGVNSHGRPDPFQFKNIWAHAYDVNDAATPSGWYRFRGEEFIGNPDFIDACTNEIDDMPECKFRMIHPSPFLKRIENGAGFVYQAKPTLLSGDLAVTSVINDSGALKLISWKVDGISKITRLDDLTDSDVFGVEAVRVHNNRILLSVIDANQKLKMMLFRVNSDGSFVKEHSYQAGTTTGLSLTVTQSTGYNDKFVTSLKDGNGSLKVIVWDVVYNEGYKIVRLGDASGSAAQAISSSGAQNFNGVFTAYRNSAGQLQLTPWQISSDGMTVTQRTGYTAGNVSSTIAVTSIEHGAVVAMKDEDSELRLISFNTSASGNVLARRETETAGTISEVAIVNPTLAGSNVATAVKDGAGNMRLIGWTVDPDGSNLRRDGSSIGEKGNQFAMSTMAKTYPGNDPRDLILVTNRNLSGDLILTTWDTNLVNP